MAGPRADGPGGAPPLFGRLGLRLRRRPLVGFVNVAWDGATHFFLLDTTVAPSHRRRGIGAALVAAAVELSKRRGGDWLHVDYEEELTSFYEGCGFHPTPAGLYQLYDD